MLLPVADASASSKKPCSSPVKMMRSSARRLRCTIASDDRVEKRRHEVAIGRGVHAVADDAREAERARQQRRVDRIARAGDRARAERQRIGFVGAPSPAARDRGAAPRRARGRSARRAPAARGADACRTASARRPARSRLIGARGHQRGDARLQRGNPAPQIQPQVERHLLVARPAGVEAAARHRRSARSSLRSTKLWTSSSGPATNAGSRRPSSRIACQPGDDRARVRPRQHARGVAAPRPTRCCR